MYWRSSASHVFVILDRTGNRREAFLRFFPAHLFSRHAIDVIAKLMTALADRGFGTVPALLSSAGNSIETITTGDWHIHAMMVANAEGEQLDVEDLTRERAQAWGAALARLHRDGEGAAFGLALADGRDRADRALALLDDDPCAETAHLVRARMLALPCDPDQYGLVHGDFELDNLAWTGEVPVAFDRDEAERSWFAADVAYAVRDLVPGPGALLDGPLPLLDAFLAGYDCERPMAVDRSRLALFFALNALSSLARLRPVLAEDPTVGQDLTSNMPPETDPPRLLRTVLEEYAEQQRTIARTFAPLCG